MRRRGTTVYGGARTYGEREGRRIVARAWFVDEPRLADQPAGLRRVRSDDVNAESA